VSYRVLLAHFVPAFCALVLNVNPAVRPQTHRLSWLETPEGSPRIIAAKLFVLGRAQIQCPDDRSGIDVRRVINPFFMRTGQAGITHEDYMPGPAASSATRVQCFPFARFARSQPESGLVSYALQLPLPLKRSSTQIRQPAWHSPGNGQHRARDTSIV
jgi:hypothetical protein